MTGEEETAQLKNLKTLLAENGHGDCSGMVLKMDIEGYEWGVFANIDRETLERFDQIVLEFHNLLEPNDPEAVLRALRNLNETHQAVHVHANNNGAADLFGGMVTPDLLEVTLVRRDLHQFEETDQILPCAMDQPNIAGMMEICLGKWNIPE